MVKYNLEKEIFVNKNILDYVDKVHFTSDIVYLEPTISDVINVDLDLLKSNYFIIKIDNPQNDDYRVSNININLNNAIWDIQRFEVLIQYKYNTYPNIIIRCNDIPVIFPWGEIEPTTIINEGESYFSTYSCRLGKTFNDNKEVIIIQSQWTLMQ